VGAGHADTAQQQRAADECAAGKQHKCRRMESPAGCVQGREQPNESKGSITLEPDLHSITVLQLSYDDAKVTIDLRPTSNLQNILRLPQDNLLIKLLKILQSTTKLPYDNQ